MLEIVCCYNCGEEPELYSEEEAAPWSWHARCGLCGIDGPMATTREAATIAWNAQELDKIRRAS
jgi:hypothetical protein